MLADLSYWLRKRPKPFRLRIRVDGEERIIEISAGKARWEAVEETIRTAGATAVECLDEKGNILRAMRLGEEEADAVDSLDARTQAEDKVLQKDRRETASMLDAYGRRMNDAFLMGAKASSVSQDALISLVGTLTEHLAMAITNLHNVSVNLANLVQESASGEPSDKNGALLQSVMAMALARSNPPAKESK
jgi:hypothetical protein